MPAATQQSKRRLTAQLQEVETQILISARGNERGWMTGKPEVIHLDVKRPTLSCDLRRVVRSQSAVCRQPVKLDYFRVGEKPSRITPSARTCCTDYNYAHGWRSPLVPNSVPIKSGRRLAPVAWARCTVPLT